MWGQVAMSLMVNPPKEGDESYKQYKEEQATIIGSLRERAHIMTDAFNACEGITCNFTEGAMYSFPQLQLPAKVWPTAKLLSMKFLRHVLQVQLLLRHVWGWVKHILRHLGSWSGAAGHQGRSGCRQGT